MHLIANAIRISRAKLHFNRLKFADDTKIVSKVGTVEDAKVLQDDLHKLFQWSKDWQMLFNR